MSNFLDAVRTAKIACGKCGAQFIRMVNDEYLYTLIVSHRRTLTSRTGIKAKATLIVTIDLVGTESAQDIADVINRALGNAAGRELGRMEVAG